MANELAKFYGVNAMELDDIGQAVGAVTTGEALPAYHHCDTDLDWLEMSHAENADWLGRVCRELAPALRADISVLYGQRLAEACNKLGIRVVDAGPWDTALERILERER